MCEKVFDKLPCGFAQLIIVMFVTFPMPAILLKLSNLIRNEANHCRKSYDVLRMFNEESCNLRWPH